MRRKTQREKALDFLKTTKRPKSAKQIATKLDVDVKSIYTMLHKAVDDGTLRLIMKEDTPYLFQLRKR